MPQRRGEHLTVIDGDLAHLSRDGTRKPQHYSLIEQKEFYLGLLHLAQSRGNKPGAAAYRYKDKFGEWPLRHWQALAPMQPNGEVLAWDRHCRIKFAKAMDKKAHHHG